MRRILLTSFVSTDSSLSCPRNPLLAATENQDERSARDRTDSKEPQKSLISMSALPEPHEGLNPALPPPALALTGGQTYQMQVPASPHLGQGQPLNMLFFFRLHPGLSSPVLRRSRCGRSSSRKECSTNFTSRLHHYQFFFLRFISGGPHSHTPRTPLSDSTHSCPQPSRSRVTRVIEIQHTG